MLGRMPSTKKPTITAEATAHAAWSRICGTAPGTAGITSTPRRMVPAPNTAAVAQQSEYQRQKADQQGHGPDDDQLYQSLDPVDFLAHAALHGAQFLARGQKLLTQ